MQSLPKTHFGPVDSTVLSKSIESTQKIPTASALNFALAKQLSVEVIAKMWGCCGWYATSSCILWIQESLVGEP